ncbi:hypothetical protein AUJ67_03090 [Candidatus Desantisbacteria bacterium CG1_02_49_89]|nr:MAG: hypothetical protein AUJ67_03090 [Candidatus Desantisbacteria bacterium CG1_02_49_89]
MDEIEELEKQGYDIIDIIAGDVKPAREVQYLVDRVVKNKGGDFYGGILFELASVRFPEDRAKALWQEILRHKYIISERLGRNIGVRVATLDYLENIKKLISAPVIIPETEFAKTLKLSTTDDLTGLYNRRYLNNRLRAMVSEAQAERSRFSVLMMDLDGFKKFNDTQGHQAGDLILQEFARVLREGLRKSDMVARYGGDEMVCILPLTDKFIAKTVASKICEQVRKDFSEVKISLSTGIAEYPTDAADDEGLILQSDAAMYRAKAFGGSAVSYFHPVEITYRHTEPGPGDVACVGDFNRWNSKKGMMKPDEKPGVWKVSLDLLAGKYKYKFLIDGSKWVTDPSQVECGDDGFGGMCSVLSVRME